MRGTLLLARLAVVAVGIAIFALVAIAVLPVLTIATSGPEGIEGMVEVGDPETGMDGTLLWASVPVSITNPAYYDIQGIRIDIALHDEEGDVIANDSIGPFDLAAGRTNDLELGLELDIDDVDPRDVEELVFDDATLTVEADVRVGYMMGMMWIEATVPFEFEWEALVEDYGLDEDGISYDPVAGSLTVPYHVDSSSMLDSMDADISIAVTDEVGPQGSGSETVTLGGNNTGSLTITLSDPSRISPGDVLRFDVELTIEGAVGSETFEYTVPGVIP